MTGWQKGRADIERLLASGDLTHRLLEEPAAHIDTAHAAIDEDPTGALQIGYDAARKAAIAAAAATQFDSTFDRLERMRRRRNAAEYPDIDTPEVTEGDARDAIDAPQRMYDAAVGIINSGKLGVFDE
jgi:hypothetical protein